MKRRLARAGFACIFLVCIAGCTYFGDRGRDLTDCLRWSGAGGTGATLQARVFIFGAGVGYSDWVRMGVERKGTFRKWSELEAGFPVSVFLTSISDAPQNHNPGDLNILLASYVRSTDLVSQYTDFENATWSEAGRLPKTVQAPLLTFPLIEEDEIDTAERFFWIEAGGGAVLGARVGVNALEILDFGLGWLFIDLLGDDARSTVPEPAKPAPGAPRTPKEPPADDAMEQGEMAEDR